MDPTRPTGQVEPPLLAMNGSEGGCGDMTADADLMAAVTILS